MFRYSQQPVREKQRKRRPTRRYATSVTTKHTKRRIIGQIPKKVVLLVLLVFLGFIVFRFSQIFISIAHVAYELNRDSVIDQGRINIVVSNGHITLASFDNVGHTINIFSLPQDVYAKVNGKREKLAATFAIAELNKAGSGGVVMDQAVSDVLGVAVDGYIQSDTITDAMLLNQNFQHQFGNFGVPWHILEGRGFVDGAQSNLTRTDYLKLWWLIHQTRFDKVVVTDLSQTNALVPGELADGSNVLGISTAATDAVLGDAVHDQTIVQEGARVTITNASGVTGEGEQFARMLTNMGVHVVQVDSADTIQNMSTIMVVNKDAAKQLVKRLSKLHKFTIIDARNSEPQLGDIAITLGAQ